MWQRQQQEVSTTFTPPPLSQVGGVSITGVCVWDRGRGAGGQLGLFSSCCWTPLVQRSPSFLEASLPRCAAAAAPSAQQQISFHYQSPNTGRRTDGGGGGLRISKTTHTERRTHTRTQGPKHSCKHNLAAMINRLASYRQTRCVRSSWLVAHTSLTWPPSIKSKIAMYWDCIFSFFYQMFINVKK